MPTVSIIVPTHNRPALLHHGLQSILDQSFEDWEAIVVDDGSEEETRDTALSFRDPRIQYSYQEKAGRSAARNRGLSQSQGEYIAFLDDDDLFFPHKIDSQLRFLQDNSDIDLVNSGVWYIDSHNFYRGIYAPWLYDTSISFHSALYGPKMTTHSALIRRGVLEGLDQWFDPELDLCEDADFFIRILQNGRGGGLLNDFVGAYRIHSSNSPSGGNEFARAYRKVLDKVFSSPDLPPKILADRSRIHAHYLLTAACRSYATYDAPSAMEFLEEACDLDSALVEEKFADQLARFAGFTGSDPRPYIEFALMRLPESCDHFRDSKREIFKKTLEFRVRKEREFETFIQTPVGESLLRIFPKIDNRRDIAVDSTHPDGESHRRSQNPVVGATNR